MKIQPIRTYAEYQALEQRERERIERQVDYYESCCRPRHRWHNNLQLVIWRKMQDRLLMGGLVLVALAAILLKMLVAP
jgi:hypothetical protein